MPNILQVVRQENIEKQYSRRLIDVKIREEIALSDDMQAKVNKGIALLADWYKGTHYASKLVRLEQVKAMDQRELVEDLFVGICYCQLPTLFTSITAQLAGRLGFDEKRAAILTVAELLSVLCETDAFDINKLSKFASLTVVSRISLSDELLQFISNSFYLPPMVCKPLTLTNNWSSGYLSYKDSVILGAPNHHSGDVCLDAVNIINGVALKLDMAFLCKCNELPKEEFTIERVHEAAAKKGKILTEVEATDMLADQIAGWEAFKARSQQVYLMLHANGNEFYLTHKYDKRGRMYSQGYHCNTQGASFKKASIELAHEEIVEGVPT